VIIDGFLNMFVAVRDAKVKLLVYAANSSNVGDSESLPKVEEIIGKSLSPYAVTKFVNEHYAHVFASITDWRASGCVILMFIVGDRIPIGPFQQ